MSCRYYESGASECRRHAPVQGGLMDFYFGDALRWLVEAHLVGFTEQDKEEMRQDLPESTEAYERSLWPRVDEGAWCGEFEPREGDA